jgi:hypothetical protein
MQRVYIGFVLLLAASLAAQNISSSLSGTIVDQSGATMAGAKVEVMEGATGFQRETITNDRGFFNFPDLKPGGYSVRVNTPGFKRYEQSGLEISSGEQRNLGTIRLSVGETSESITVTAESAPVQLGSSERSGTLTGKELGEMA